MAWTSAEGEFSTFGKPLLRKCRPKHIGRVLVPVRGRDVIGWVELAPTEIGLVIVRHHDGDAEGLIQAATLRF